MDFFTLGRKEGFSSNYGERHTSAQTDIVFSGLVLTFFIFLFSVFLTLPAYGNRKKYLGVLAYTVMSLLIGGIILVCNYGYGWEVGYASITSPYKPVGSTEMQGQIGLHVSLRGINISLKGDLKGIDANNFMRNEIIDYNENFSWEWVQGRFGFGYYAGRISRDYRAAVIKGVPTPILQLSEYFTIDGEGIRFGRHYRLAGYYTHFFLWTAFATWVLCNVLFCTSIQFGAMCLALTGLIQEIAVLVWMFNGNGINLQVPFESFDGQSEVILSTKYGIDFYLVLFNGILCILMGIVIIPLNFQFPEKVGKIFGIEGLALYHEEYQTLEEVRRDMKKFNLHRPDQIELGSMNGGSVGNLLHPTTNEKVKIRRRRQSLSFRSLSHARPTRSSIYIQNPET